MKKKNEKLSATDTHQKTTLNKQKKGVGNVDNRTGATNKVKPRAGRGLANEGTNVSYDEER